MQSTTEYLEWDVATWTQALDVWTAKGRTPLAGARVLEIGSRHGGLSLWFADQGADVVCSDRGGPSDRAMELHSRRGVSSRIGYVDLDATALDFDGEFDIVVFKSVLGSIGGWHGAEAQRAMIHGVHRALRAGGELLFAENLAGPRVVQALRQRFVPWNEKWRYVEPAELTTWLSVFESSYVTHFGTVALLGRTERQRRLLAHADRHVCDRIGGPKNRYVAAGVARKSGR